MSEDVPRSLSCSAELAPSQTSLLSFSSNPDKSIRAQADNRRLARKRLSRCV